MTKAAVLKTAGAFCTAAESYRDDLQGTIDELEDKQGEHENEARGEKIDKLSSIVQAIDDAVEYVNTLEGELENQ